MQALSRAHEAAEAAADHAEAVNDGWREDALERVRQYAATHPTFIIEDVRLVAERDGLAKPPSRRAWGAVALRARKEGVIQSCGFAMSTAPTANPTPVTKWRSMTHREAA